MTEPQHPVTAGFRPERDSLGEAEVPAAAYWGISTLRAIDNFPVSGRTIGAQRSLVWALGAVKFAAARANEQAGVLSPVKSAVIQEAAREVMDGRLDGQFLVDAIQGGAGTSSNMNANEVIANRALELLGHRKGDYAQLHPIDDVNRSQSTNDVYPTAIKIALHREIVEFCAEHGKLVDAFDAKAAEFSEVRKIGRTQLQDAVPMSLGQEFGAFAETLREDGKRLRELLPHLCETNLGATAIGTGVTAPPGYRSAVIEALNALAPLQLTPAGNLVEATSDTGVFLLVSGLLKRSAVKPSKICNDLRLLSSGPQAGFAEIFLPPVRASGSGLPDRSAAGTGSVRCRSDVDRVGDWVRSRLRLVAGRCLRCSGEAQATAGSIQRTRGLFPRAALAIASRIQFHLGRLARCEVPGRSHRDPARLLGTPRTGRPGSGTGQLIAGASGAVSRRARRLP